LINLIFMTLLWSIAAFSFYTNNTFIKYVPGNFENNVLVMTSTDIIASLSAGALLGHFSAKNLFASYATMSAFAGASILMFVDPATPTWYVPFLVGLSRFGVVSSFTTIYLTHPSFFPTLFAVTSMGISNFAARLIVILAPLIAEVAYPLPIVIVTILQVVACVSALFLIEPPNLSKSLNNETKSDAK